jgi:hypothetical protein
MSARRCRQILIAVTATVSVLFSQAESAVASPVRGSLGARAIPESPVIQGTRLAENRFRLLLGDPALRQEVGSLTKQADGWLGKGPWSVIDKPKPGPSGDIHDYVSQAPYFWASKPKTPDNPQGCPYIERDGVRNPEAAISSDRPEAGNVLTSVPALSLAWYYTGKKEYAEHAAEILRTWFVTPPTRMNPNLNYSQGIPCRYDGRSIGIIDFAQYFTMSLDAVAILDTGAPGWTAGDRAGMRAWSQSYLDWLTTSPLGVTESAAKNNHGSYAAMQIAGLAAAMGDDELARRTVSEVGRRLIDSQIAADGALPLELARTRSWHYSNFDLVALARLAAIGRQLGVDLWAYRGPVGQSLFKAADYLIPAATGAVSWPHPELELSRAEATDVIHAAADAGDLNARCALPELQALSTGDVWDLRPAAQDAG